MLSRISSCFLIALTASPLAAIQTNAPTRIDPTAPSLQAALDRGGVIQFNMSGTISLSTNLNVTKDAVVDATDRSIIIDGSGQTRLFYVHTNVTLSLQHLILTNGYNFDRDHSRPPDLAIGLSRGGAILSDGAALLEISDCQFTHNRVSGTGGSNIPGFGYGGDIYANGGYLQITNCVFRSSSSYGGNFDTPFRMFLALGGSIYSANGHVSINSSVFDGCLAAPLPGSTAAAGGAIASSSSNVRIFNSRFLNNSSGSGPEAGSSVTVWPGAGGAIFNSGGALTVEDCQFLTNFVAGTLVQGAAIYNDSGGTLTCAGSFFGHHKVLSPTLTFYPRLYRLFPDQLGGAVFNGGTASFVNSTFEDNAAQSSIDGSGYGGAIYSSNALSAVNCTFYRNQALGGAYSTYFSSTTKPPPEYETGSGGAIFVSQGTANVLFSTFYENRVAGGTNPVTNIGPALGAALAAGTNAIVNIRANIFANLQPTTNFTQLSGTMVDLGFNLSSDPSTQLTLASSRRNTDPKLGIYGMYGGLTPLFPLLPGSPAIDAGPTNDIPPFDQRGAPRLVGTATDIGSYEVLANGKLVLTSASPGLNLFFPFDPNQNWTIQTSTNLTVWEPYDGMNTNQSGLITATINHLGGIHYFRAIGK